MKTLLFLLIVSLKCNHYPPWTKIFLGRAFLFLCPSNNSLRCKLIYLCPTVHIKYYSIPLSLCYSVHMYDSHTSGEKLWFVISGLKIKQRQKTRETLEICLLPSLFIVLSFFFKLEPAGSAAYHSFDSYGDEWLWDEYWKGDTDSELCFICACLYDKAFQSYFE